MHIHTLDRHGGPLLDDDLDAHLSLTDIVDATGAHASAVVAPGAVVALDALQVGFEYVPVEDLVVVEHAAEHAQKLRRFAACQVLLQLRAVDRLGALDIDAIDREAALWNGRTGTRG